MNINNKLKDNIYGYFFISPWLLCFLVFTVFPVIMSLNYSFTDFDILSAPKYIGLENYSYLLTADKKFWGSVKVTFLYAFVSAPLRLIFAFFIAQLLVKKHSGQGIYRSLYYLPSIIGGSVAIAIVWKTIFGKNGALEALLLGLGIEQQYSMLGNKDTAIWSLVIMAIWQFGSPMLIFLAGLKNIPIMYYESANIDGAGSFRKFLHITIPLISPIFLFNLVMQMITAFMMFTQGYIITGGGPMDSTLFYVIHMYKTTFEYFEAGRGSAMAWMLLLVVSLITVVIFKFSKYWVFYEGEKE